MHIVPGRTWQRWGAAVFAVISLGTWLSWKGGYVRGAVVWLPFALFVTFGLLSSVSVYAKWMRFAEWLNIWVVRALFSVIFLTVVPFVWLLRLVSGQGHSPKRGDSFWLPRKRPSQSGEDMQSMG